jgi:hypothetical protein
LAESQAALEKAWRELAELKRATSGNEEKAELGIR